MSYKKWFLMFLISVMIIFLPVFGLMGFNYYIDPYWNFSHAHANNDYQNGFSERLQKSNLLASSNPPVYDSVLIGTSRVTYMNTDTFKDDAVFNYGLSSLHLDEYESYLSFAEQVNGEPLKTIYMEVSLGSYDGRKTLPMEEPEFYLEEARNNVLDYTSLFSRDTYEKSLVNYKASKLDRSPKPRSYTRDNQVITTFPNNRLEASKAKFREEHGLESERSDFVYKENFKERMIAIKQQHPTSRFVVFTDMVPIERLQLFLKEPSYFEAYERSMRELVEVYGSVVSFHVKSDLSQNDNYYFDFFHYYPEVGDQMIRALETGEGEGVVYRTVTAENVDDYLRDIEGLIAEY